MKERDTYQETVPALISKEFANHAPKMIEELFQSYIQNNVITRSIQDQAEDIELWEVLKCKFENSLVTPGSCRTYTFRSTNHDDHEEDDAPPEGEKRVKRHKSSKISKSTKGSSSKQPTTTSKTYVSERQQQQECDTWAKESVIDEDKVILEDKTPEMIKEFQNINKHVLTIFANKELDGESDSLGKQTKIHKAGPRAQVFYGPQRNPNEPLRITEVVRITIDQQHGLDYMKQIIVMRENNKPDSFSTDDFKYLNKNDIEDLYYLCLNKKVNLYEIRVMYLAEIVKFCDATLDRVLKEIKLKIFEIEFLKKTPLLGELDPDIMKAYEREISKRLQHHKKMRRIKTSIQELPTDLDMKPLPKHLDYAFLEKDSFLPVVISTLLKEDENKRLVSVHKNHKEAFAWKTFDIPDSPWVSHVHYVPKKGGMTVVTNEKNELVPTRTVTGWRVCIGYRKLNEATQKDHFPLPFMDQMLERLAGNKFFCFLDGFSGYF
ncbi:hypothetical protein Tco_0371055 [Tanacetum coccineum]